MLIARDFYLCGSDFMVSVSEKPTRFKQSNVETKGHLSIKSIYFQHT